MVIYKGFKWPTKDTFSLAYQEEEAIKFAQQKGFTITESFGDTAESASHDFTRKEFTMLINKVKKAKIKPFGILVYIVNRFSRTGGHAIGIVDLIGQLDVHLIEVISGIDTPTELGKIAIYSKLIEAKKQNLIDLNTHFPE